MTDESAGEPAPSRRLFRIPGEDRESFLQGLVTNDVAKLRDGLVYAALLGPQGRYLADFLLVPAGDAILMDVDQNLAEALPRRLSMYRLRARVTIEPADIAVTRGLGPAPEGAFADPRHPSLGWRRYGAPCTAAQRIDWDAIRVAATIPQSAVELVPDETLILEAGFERLHGVDFRKGCYVGQEVTARMKHKTELRKGLVTLAIDGEAPVGSAITADGKPAGTLFTRSGGRAIAQLRLDRAGGDLRAGAARLQFTG